MNHAFTACFFYTTDMFVFEERHDINQRFNHTRKRKYETDRK